MSGYNYESFGQCELAGPEFWAVANVGTRAPDFTLTDVDGNRVSRASFAGRRQVELEFGSVT